MSLMEKIFGAAKPNVVPANVPLNQPAAPVPNPTNNLQTPPNTGTQQTENTSPNGVIPTQPASPLSEFKTLWDTAPVDPNAPPAPAGFDPQKMLEAAGKVDFSKVLNPEDLAKIAAGGDGAIQALMNALNKTSQTVFGQSTVVAQKMVSQAQEDTRNDILRDLPGLVKKLNVSESLATENPAFSDPALIPVVTALQSQLAEKYPKATSAELRKMATDYMTGAAEMIAPRPKNSGPAAPGTQKSTDWEKYFAEDQSQSS